MSKQLSKHQLIVISFIVTTFVYFLILGFNLLSFGLFRESSYIRVKNDWMTKCILSTTICNSEHILPLNDLLIEINKFSLINNLSKDEYILTNNYVLLITENKKLGIVCFYYEPDKTKKIYPTVILKDFFYPHSY